MEMLGSYQRITALSNKDAGSCRWCFAVKGGRTFFIKEFMEPKYPGAGDHANPERMQKKLRKCYEFEQRKKRVYAAINENTDGVAVRVTDFFRVGAKYYMAMPRVEALQVEPEQIAAFPEYNKRFLCGVVAHALGQLHQARFIHSDIKHSNIMMVYSKNGCLTAKLIDFDSSYPSDEKKFIPLPIRRRSRVTRCILHRR